MPAIYHEGSWLGNATDPEVLVKDTVGWTGKNLLKNTAESGSYQGITYTVNSDKSITINGTNTDSAQHSVMVGIVTLDAGAYKVNGLKNNGGYTSFWINLYNLTDGSNIKDVRNANEDVTFTLSAPKQVRVNVYWAGNATVSNITVYPMLRKADITDPTYEPYHESVEVMYEEEIHGVNLLPRFTLADLKAINANGTWNNNVYTRNGITFTVDENTQTVSISSGTSTAYTNFRFNINLKELLKRDIPYTVNGMSNSIGRLFIYDRGADRVLSENHGGDSSFVIPSNRTFTNNIELIFDVNQNVTIQATTIRPMLRKSDIEDSTYRPYNPQAIQNQLNAQGVLGAKNLLKNTYPSQTVSGVTITHNSDDSLSFSGTATAQIVVIIKRLIGTLTAGQKYILSGIKGGSNSTYFMTYNDGSNNPYYINLYDGESEFIAVNESDYPQTFVGLYIRSGQNMTGVIIKPMIRLASDPDDTYQPYAMTNRELTEKKVDKSVIELNNADLNDITETGFYYIRGGCTNVPDNIAYLGLKVQKNSDSNIHQMVLGASAIYARIKTGSPATWSSWYKFTGTVVS